MRYRPSRLVNDVMRLRSLFSQYGQVIGSKRHCPVHRPQISRRSAAGLMNANSGSPPHSGQQGWCQSLSSNLGKQRLGAARQERAHRQQQHLIEQLALGVRASACRRAGAIAASYQFATTASIWPSRASPWMRS